MKLCSCSYQYKNIIEIILNDDVKNFINNKPIDFSGQIDKMSFFNFCLVSQSIKIIQYIIKSKTIRNSISVNLKTLKLLMLNKKLNVKQKTYIYNNIIKKNINISQKKLYKIIVTYDLLCIQWIRKKTIKEIDIKLLFENNINHINLSFCRKNKINFIPILISINQNNIISFEDHIDCFTDKELIELINTGLTKNKSYVDINLLDSIIKILKNKQYLISEIDIDLLTTNIEKEDFLSFLNMDIEKIFLYKKLNTSIKKRTNTIHKI